MGNFHTHDDYSTRDAIQRTDKIAKYQIEHGFNYFCITNHGTMAGFNEAMEIQDKLRKDGVDITFYPGCEYYLAPEADRDMKNIVLKILEFQKILKKKTSSKEEKDVARAEIEKLQSNHNANYYHVTVLAFNQTGLLNLYKINNEGNLYYKHRVTFESLLNHNEGLIVLTGCPAGIGCQAVMNGEIDRARSYFSTLKSVFGDRVYCEIQYHNGVIGDENYPLEARIRYEHAVYTKMISIARECGLKLCGTYDSHYTNKEDKKYWMITRKAFAPKMSNFTGEYHMRPNNSDFCVYTKDGMKAIEAEIAALPIEERTQDRIPLPFDEVEAYLTIEELDASDREIENRLEKNIVLPRSKYISTQEHRETLERLVWTGFKNKRIGTEFEEQSLLQIPYELSVIQTKGFDKYFLDVKKIVDTAWKNGILVGPGRGSGAGSEAVYLIDITKTDPLMFGLMFERFLNAGRDAMPDIDLDLESNVCNSFDPNDAYFNDMNAILSKEIATDEEIRGYWDRYRKLIAENGDVRRKTVLEVSGYEDFNKPIFDMPADHIKVKER